MMRQSYRKIPICQRLLYYTMEMEEELTLKFLGCWPNEGQKRNHANGHAYG